MLHEGNRMKTRQSYLETEKKIKKAVIDLIGKKGLEKITVKDIIQIANINRSTFYRHYIDKQTLVENYRQKILDRTKHIISQELDKTIVYQSPQETNIKYYPLFIRFIRMIAADWDFYHAWLSDGGDQKTVAQILKLISVSINSRLDELKGNHHLTPLIPEKYVRKLLVSQLWTIFITWINQDNQGSVDEVLEILMRTRYMSPYDLLGLKGQ